MSLIIGDRTSGVFVTGFTDCVGTNAENLDLRRRRVDALVAAMPAAAQARVQFSSTFGTSDFLDTNATAAGRARNRAAVMRFTADRTVTATEQVPKADNIDEYLFLVRTVERKLGLTAPTLRRCYPCCGRSITAPPPGATRRSRTRCGMR